VSESPHDTPRTRSATGDSAVRQKLVPAEVREALAQHSPTYDRYIAVKELGRGGMGVVFRAWDSDLGRWVALKVMIGGSLSGEAERERFLREAQTAAQFSHPNIAQVYGVGIVRDELYLAMQFIEGKTLGQLSGKEMPLRRAAELLRDSAYALQHAHDRNVIHRDIKPQNLMVAKNGQVFVLDFGLARQTDQKSNLSMSGQAIGTPAYMSPEQARGDRHITPATDVYALGATLYYAITGKKPFDAPNAHATIDAVLKDPPVPPSKRNPQVPPELEAITLMAMQKLPARRYRSAQDFGDDLQRFLLKEPVRARPPSFVERLTHVASKHKTATVATGVGLAGIVALAVGLSMLSAEHARKQGELQAEKARGEKKLVEEAAEIAKLGQEIEAWTVNVHNPPHPLQADLAWLRAKAGELELTKSESKVRWRFLGRANEWLFRLTNEEAYYKKAVDCYGKAEAWEDRGRVQLGRYRRIVRLTGDQRNIVGRERLTKDAQVVRDAVVADFGKSPEAALWLKVLDKQDVYRDAIARAQRADRLLDADAWDLAAEAALHVRKYDEAVQHSVWAARIRESDPELQVTAAYTLMYRGNTNRPRPKLAGPDFAEADRHCDMALTLSPDHADALELRARIAIEAFWCLWEAGDVASLGGPEAMVARLKKGAECARKAVEMGRLENCFQRVNLLLRIGMSINMFRMDEDPTPYLERVVPESDRYKKSVPELNMPSERGFSYVALCEWQIRQPRPDGLKCAEYAEASERLAAEFDEKNHDRGYYPGLCWYYTALIQRSGELMRKAADFFTQGIQINPSAHFITAFRARAYVELRRFDEAMKDARTVGDPKLIEWVEQRRRGP